MGDFMKKFLYSGEDTIFRGKLHVSSPVGRSENNYDKKHKVVTQRASKWVKEKISFSG